MGLRLDRFRNLAKGNGWPSLIQVCLWFYETQRIQKYGRLAERAPSLFGNSQSVKMFRREHLHLARSFGRKMPDFAARVSGGRRKNDAAFLGNRTWKVSMTGFQPGIHGTEPTIENSFHPESKLSEKSGQTPHA